MLTELPNYTEQLARCQRFYVQSWKGPVSSISTAGACGFTAGHDGSHPSAIVFPVEMRATPDITVYSPVTKNDRCGSNWTTDADVSIRVVYANPNRAGLSRITGSSLDKGQSYAYHYSASAEL